MYRVRTRVQACQYRGRSQRQRTVRTQVGANVNRVDNVVIPTPTERNAPMIIEIFPVRTPGKLADAALRFEPGEPLYGFTLSGFQLWAPRDGQPPSINFPCLLYTSPSPRDS